MVAVRLENSPEPVRVSETGVKNFFQHSSSEISGCNRKTFNHKQKDKFKLSYSFLEPNKEPKKLKAYKEKNDNLDLTLTGRDSYIGSPENYKKDVAHNSTLSFSKQVKHQKDFSSSFSLKHCDDGKRLSLY